MDIYQILVTHNRGWTFRETICFAIIFLLAVIMFSLLLYWHKICLSQMIAGLLLLIFLAVVFVSTVFTRDPGERQHQLELFWSWKEILGIPPTGRLGATGTRTGLLEENILNMILLFPAGVLLPFVMKRKARWYQAVLVGIVISAGIEVSQLLLCRGLFEWDDIIHNTLGCLIGSKVGNWIRRKHKI